MRHRQWKDSLQRSVDALTPDVLQQILVQTAEQPQDNTLPFSPKKKGKKRWLISLAVAASLGIVLGQGVYQEYFMKDSIISIDVNPSVEMITNKQNKVLRVEAKNQEGVKVLDGMGLDGLDLKTASNAIVGSMFQQGYLSAGNNNILVSVANEDPKKSEKIRGGISKDISQILASQNVSAHVINQSVAPQTSARKWADQYNISFGKAVLIEKIISKDSTLTFEALVGLSVGQIAEVLEVRKIDLSDVLHFERDHSLTENLEETLEDLSEGGENTTGPCPRCSSDCICEECGDFGGCDLGCDDCAKNCKNYQEDD